MHGRKPPELPEIAVLSAQNGETKIPKWLFVISSIVYNCVKLSVSMRVGSRG
jgi:hypothetical protein